MMVRVLVVSVLLLLGSVSAYAAQGTKGPILADLMNLPSYRAAWISMLAGATVPPWIEHYAKTLDGPATPSIAVQVGDDPYTLGFTCQANGCGDNQLYVLFSPGGAKAWGLLLTGKKRKWLGSPDKSIQDAFLSGLE
jgi:Inhibitor of vertebrate lysozyme (Ivy)